MRTLLALMAVSLVGSTAGAEVRVSVRDGRVVIVANDATVAEILAEWGRVGQTRIVNADRLPPGVLTLELQDVSEQQALDVLLRETSGYLSHPRSMADPNASLFDRIVIMPPSVIPMADAETKPSNANPVSLAAPGAPFADLPDPVDNPGDEVSAAPASVVVIGVPPGSQGTAGFRSRQMLEVVDPRNFQLPPDSPRIPTPSPTMRQP